MKLPLHWLIIGVAGVPAFSYGAYTLYCFFSARNDTEYCLDKDVDCANSMRRQIDLYHTMLKQKILPVQPLIQCEAGRAKTKLFVPLGLKIAAA